MVSTVIVYFLVVIFLISQPSKVIRAISFKKIKAIKAIKATKNIVATIKAPNYTIKAILTIRSRLRLLLNSFYKLRKKKPTGY